MKKLLLFFVVAISITALMVSCNSDEPEEDNLPIEHPNDNGSFSSSNDNTDNSEKSRYISNIVKTNVSADVEYTYFTFTIELYTYLTDAGRYFEGRNDIEYGIEWSYTYNTDMNYSYFLKSQNGYMRVTKVSVNHYSVIAPVFTWPDNKDKENVMNDLSIQYSALKQLEKEGSLGKEDKQFMLQIENILTPYMSEVNAYRGKVFVEIDGERYYVKSFQK